MVFRQIVTKFPEGKEESCLLENMLSIRASEFVVTRVGLPILGRSIFEHIVSRKSETIQSL